MVNLVLDVGNSQEIAASKTESDKRTHQENIMDNVG